MTSSLPVEEIRSKKWAGLSIDLLHRDPAMISCLAGTYVPTAMRVPRCRCGRLSGCHRIK